MATGILISGAFHTGKTVLAQRLPQQYKYPHMSMNYLKMSLIRSVNTELTPPIMENLLAGNAEMLSLAKNTGQIIPSSTSNTR